MTNALLSIVSGRGFAICFMATEIDVSVESSVAKVALRSSFLATKGNGEVERDCLLEELNGYKWETGD